MKTKLTIIVEKLELDSKIVYKYSSKVEENNELNKLILDINHINGTECIDSFTDDFDCLFKDDLELFDEK